MKHIYSCFILLLPAVLFLSCRGNEPKRIPSTLPHVRGYIKSIKKTAGNGGDITAIVLIQAMEGMDTNYKEASIKIDESTLIEDQSGEKLTIEQLREGHEVEAWFEGDLLESPPIQGTAKAIRIKD